MMGTSNYDFQEIFEVKRENAEMGIIWKKGGFCHTPTTRDHSYS